MEIIVRKDKAIQNKVPANKIHGKYPYKSYLQMIGNSLYGEYIAVISNTPIKNGSEQIDRIIIQLEDKMSLTTKKSINSNMQGMRPNTVDNKTARYKVKEVNVLEVGQTPILVFRPIINDERTNSK